MAAMTDVPAPVGIWTLAYTSSGTPTVTVQCRDPASDLLVRINGSSATANDSANAAAMTLRPSERLTLTLANSDLLFVRPMSPTVPSRATVLAA